MAKVIEYDDDTLVVLNGSRILIFALIEDKKTLVLELDLAVEAYDQLLDEMASELDTVRNDGKSET